MHRCTWKKEFGCYGISVISLIRWGAVPNFDQQVVLCNTEQRVRGLTRTVAALKGNLKGVFTHVPPTTMSQKVFTVIIRTLFHII